MIRLHCNNCGAHLKVHDDQIGRTLGCPKCRTKIKVPAGKIPEPAAVSAPYPGDAAGPPAPPAPPVPPAPGPLGAPPANDEPRHEPEPPPIPEQLRAKPQKRDLESPGRPGLPPEQEAILHRVIDSLIRAISASKLTFFGLATIANGLITMFLASAIGWLVYKTESSSVAVLFVVPMFASIGLEGVIAGGVAFMFVQERKGGSHGMAAGIQFGKRRFGPLFVDSVVVVLLVLILFSGLNLTILQLNDNKQIGSLLGGALFLPQIICNVLLVLAMLTCVLVPCIVVVNDAGWFGGLKRFFQYLVQHGRSLLIHFAVSLYFGIQLSYVVYFVLLPPFLTTLSTNGPDAFSWDSLIPSGEEQLFGTMDEGLGDDFSGHSDQPFSNLDEISSDKEADDKEAEADSSREVDNGPWGDGLRWLAIAIVLFVPFCYLCVFWIGSFTRFSQDLEYPSDPAREINVDVSVD